jgi:hypothetical protein
VVEENAGVSMIRGGEVVSMVEEVSGTNFGHGSRMRTNVSYSSFSVRTLPPIMVMAMEAAGSQKRVKQGKCEVSDIPIIFVFVDINDTGSRLRYLSTLRAALAILPLLENAYGGLVCLGHVNILLREDRRVKDGPDGSKGCCGYPILSYPI